jgi:hypothetical protein
MSDNSSQIGNFNPAEFVRDQSLAQLPGAIELWQYLGDWELSTFKYISVTFVQA